MKITQYAINEQTARTAKELNSFGEYVKNSATNGYIDTLSRFQKAVEELIEKFANTATAETLDLVNYYADKYSKKLAEAINRENAIRSMCPSVMISGAGNFPVRKKEKQNKALDNWWAECGQLYDATNNYYYNKIEALLSNKTIYSNDALAVEKLQNKLNDLQEVHAKMKARNAYYRKNKTMKGCEGVSDELAEEIDKAIEKHFSWEKQPYPSYELSSNLAEQKRIKNRIEQITTLKAEAQQPTENKYPHVDGVEVVENADAMRIQLIFDGKPDEATRELLKHNGFHWSPTFSAWQRQLNDNGIYATKKVLEKLQNT